MFFTYCINYYCYISTESPSAPVSVSVSNVTNTSVILSWLPPEDGGGRDLSEIHYTITATGEYRQLNRCFEACKLGWSIFECFCEKTRYIEGDLVVASPLSLFTEFY